MDVLGAGSRSSDHPTVAIRLALFTFSLFIVTGTSLLVNVTVDDTFGDPTTGFIPQYLPDEHSGTIGAWHSGNSSETDDWSTSHWTPGVLDVFEIYNQTWHDSTPQNGPAQVVVNFTGTAVYVYNVVPNTVTKTTTKTNMTFSIDGKVLDNFTHPPDETGIILYNQLVFSITELPPSPHTLVISAEGEGQSFICFDYLLYTTDADKAASETQSSKYSTSSTTTSTVFVTTTMSPSSRAPLDTVLGAVFGGVMVLIGIALGVYFLLRRRSRYLFSITNPTPFNPHHESERSDYGAQDGARPSSPMTSALTGTSTEALMNRCIHYPATRPDVPTSDAPGTSEWKGSQQESSMYGVPKARTISWDASAAGTETVFGALETEVAALGRELSGFQMDAKGETTTR
ncbi:hypothetical protein DICSQDRAFT_128272 [Dichomitus squalens LYAD-421 SS1]|uniref:Mid2 domain-containing protein n=1 Tax=Dichomitus squalens (strain LYAD-421) TaxID=732165 RepID=R7SUG2_DICSQ|nr:uncharacterized protein DICSQDRAFT_128272 [Dichomitus squalens LYAD-421 SS1]EJF59405.1 hypothetical protein DICSQDRAFT_128272 [Dichomitus squalens LYAD-421 SS1]